MEAVPANHERDWNMLLSALDKYSTVLTDRANALAKADTLRRQNAELKTLLHQYLTSKVCVCMAVIALFRYSVWI